MILAAVALLAASADTAAGAPVNMAVETLSAPATCEDQPGVVPACCGRGACRP